MSENVESFLGGENYLALKSDGTSEPVVIQHFSIRRIIETLPLLDDEPGMVEKFCGKETGWADKLAIASYEAILEKGWAANYPILAAYLGRRQKMLGEFQQKFQPPATKP